MAQSNQPFKRPNLTESEEMARIPPPAGQESTSFRGAGKILPGAVVVSPTNQPIPTPPTPPTQEEINWAVQLEENVQKRGYKPSEVEMGRYQDIANRILYFQQVQNQVQYQAQQQQQRVVQVVQKKSKFWLFFNTFIFIVACIIFWAKVSVITLQPSYFTPKGKIYFVLKPEAFSKVFYTLNMDKVYEEKLKKGFSKEDLALDSEKEKNKKNKKVPTGWFSDPQYWEENYILAIPYITINTNI